MLWYERGDVSPLKSVEACDVRCLDVETTGLDPCVDEILQLAVVDGAGAVLFNDLFKPIRQKAWPDAEAVHGIAPSAVMASPSLLNERTRIQSLLSGARLLVGYNLSFDLAFLAAVGVEIPAGLQFDVMREFAPVFQRRSKDGCYRWWSLSVCARHYGIEYYPHDALEDARATLACFQHMMVDDGSRQCRCGIVPYLRIVERHHAGNNLCTS